MHIEEFDPAAASEPELRAWYDLDSSVERAWRPDAVTPYAESIAWLQHPGIAAHHHWVIRDGDSLLGAARVMWWLNSTSDRNCDVFAAVRADRRREGIGSELMRVALEFARQHDRSTVGLSVPAGDPAETFLERLGAENKSIGRQSSLRLADVDRSLLERWVSDAATHAAGYDLVSWRGDTPEEHLDEYCRVSSAINDAPKDALDIGDDRYEPDIVRTMEQAAHRRHHEWWTICARELASGRFAGVTVLQLPRHWPEHAYQDNTAVDPAYRGRRIGRWIKAQMVLDVLADRPDVQRIDTWNAASNEWMLAINLAMGFETALHWGEWQADARTALSALGSASATSAR